MCHPLLYFIPFLLNHSLLMYLYIHINLYLFSSKLSLTNELTTIYRDLKPLWTYDMDLWGTAKTLYTKKIQSFQSEILTFVI